MKHSFFAESVKVFKNFLLTKLDKAMILESHPFNVEFLGVVGRNDLLTDVVLEILEQFGGVPGVGHRVKLNDVLFMYVIHYDFKVLVVVQIAKNQLSGIFYYGIRRWNDSWDFKLL